MSDRGKVVLSGSDTVQSITVFVKWAMERERTIKLKIGASTVHVAYNKRNGRYSLLETGLESCSPAAIAQRIYDSYLQPANLAPAPTHHSLSSIRAHLIRRLRAKREKKNTRRTGATG